MDCTKCGCNRLNLIDAGSDYGRPWVVFQCDHCQSELRVGRRRRKNVPTYSKTVCPECGSKDAPVSSHGQKPARLTGVRYHKCRDCGATFKTVESA